MTKCYLTELRDKKNKATGEEKERLQAEWEQKHKELEALKEKDERNYEGFGNE